jgi:hypothetical protein
MGAVPLIADIAGVPLIADIAGVLGLIVLLYLLWTAMR